MTGKRGKVKKNTVTTSAAIEEQSVQQKTEEKIDPFPALPVQKEDEIDDDEVVLEENDDDDAVLLEDNEPTEAASIAEERNPPRRLLSFSEVKQDRIMPVAEQTPAQNSWASRLFQTSPDSVMAGEELRIASDGYTYTKQEFFDYYGSFIQWERAPRIVAQTQHVPLLTKIEESDDTSEQAKSEASESDHEDNDDLFSEYGDEEIDDVALARMMTRVAV